MSENLRGIFLTHTVVADFGDNLSQKSATVAEFGDCRRFLVVFCDSRRFRRQSHFSATVWTGLQTSVFHNYGLSKVWNMVDVSCG